MKQQCIVRGMHTVRSLPGYIVDNASENGIPPTFLASALVMPLKLHLFAHYFKFTLRLIFPVKVPASFRWAFSKMCIPGVHTRAMGSLILSSTHILSNLWPSMDARTNGSITRSCVNVRPLPGQSGLSCGGDSQTGPRLANEDRTIATDLQDYGSARAWGGFEGLALVVLEQLRQRERRTSLIWTLTVGYVNFDAGEFGPHGGHFWWPPWHLLCRLFGPRGAQDDRARLEAFKGSQKWKADFTFWYFQKNSHHFLDVFVPLWWVDLHGKELQVGQLVRICLFGQTPCSVTLMRAKAFEMLSSSAWDPPRWMPWVFLKRSSWLNLALRQVPASDGGWESTDLWKHC